ncbi:MAG: hypothetical protein EXQ85_03490 [Alphaproteobacteria bacterium]|nr:hypothetical protein [Alphaproteobacteria bacterium]
MKRQPPAARSTLDIAYWFQTRSDSAGEPLSQRKLHFLLYLAQAHYAAEHDSQKVMPATFLATEAGPLDPNIYQLYEHGYFETKGAMPSFAIETYLHEIWARYGKKTTKQLDAIVGRDNVWRQVLNRGSLQEIPVKLMFSAYGGGGGVLPMNERAGAGADRKVKEQEYWTPTGKRAKKWVPGISRLSSSAPSGNSWSATARPAKSRRDS